MYDETPDAHPTIEALRKRRRYLGVTQRELGALLGVSEHHVRRLELGDVKAKDADIAAAARQLQEWATNPPARKRFHYGRPPKCLKSGVLQFPTVRDQVHASVTDVPATIAEISAASGVCNTSTRKHLRALVTSGDVVCVEARRDVRRTVEIPVHRELLVTLPVKGYCLAPCTD